MNQSRPPLFAALLFLSALGPVQTFAQGGQPDDQKATVRGTVINVTTHEPIGRALVTTPGDQMAMFTDAEGHFEFAIPSTNNGGGPGGLGQPRRMRTGAGGPLWLTARKPGFLDRPNEAGQTQATPGSDVTLSLIPEAIIKGRVILSTGDAAIGISVQIYFRQVQDGALGWLPIAQARVNSNGEFRFAELSLGSYKIVTREQMDNDPADTTPEGQLYGFAPVYYPGVPDFVSAGLIQLTAGQTVEADLSVTRQPYYPVRIPVVNAEPSGGIRVSVSVQGRRGPEYSLGYNAGKQQIEGLLPNGNYLVEASSNGQNSGTGAVNLAVAGAPAEGPGLVLARNSSIRLQVAEEFSDTNKNSTNSWSDGAHTYTTRGPRSYLDVRVQSADDFSPPRVAGLRAMMGPNDDSLVIDDLAPGRYWLRVTSSRGYVAAATMGGVDLLHQPFSLVPGPITPIEITMRDDMAELDGTVTDLSPTIAPQGTPMPQVYIYCVPLPDSPGQFQQLGVSADGTFKSQAMAPGTYRIMAFRTPQTNMPYRDAEAMRAYDSTGQVVHLGAGQKAAVQLPSTSGIE